MIQKNPTALFMQRMAMAGKGAGSMSALLEKYFRDNFGKTNLPKRVADFQIFHNLSVVGQTVVTFFSGNYNAQQTNWPGSNFVAPESEHMVLQRIKCYQGIAANPEESPWLAGVSDALAKNGRLTISCNGVAQLVDLPLTAFNPTVTDDSIGCFDLQEPIVILGQTDAKAQVTFTDAPATANLNLRLVYEGIRFIGG